MNKVILIGRLTRDPEVRTTASQVNVATFTVAVDRRYKNAAGERQADFISCVAWRAQADLLGRYFKKGHRIGIVGNIQTRNYEDKDGKRVYVTEVVVDEIEFLETRRDQAGDGAYTAPASTGQGFAQRSEKVESDDSFSILDDDDTSLPFEL